MSLLVSCSCGKQLRVPDEYVGRRVKCPGCGEPQLVTTAGPSTPVPAKTNPAPSRVDEVAVRPGMVLLTCVCGKTMQTRAEYAGRSIRCPACQEAVLVPVSAEPDSESRPRSRISTQRSNQPAGASRLQREDDADREGRSIRKKAPRKEKGSPWLLVVLLVGGLLVLAGGIVGAWLLLRGGSGDASSADLALVPANAEGFVTLRVAEVWKHQAIQDAFNAVPAEARAELTGAEKDFGLAVADIERVTAVFQDAEAEKIWIVFSTSKVIDRSKLMKKIELSDQEKTYKGKPYYLHKDRHTQLAFHFLSDKSFVLGPEVGVKACLDHLDKPVTEGKLADAIKTAKGDHHLVGGFAMKPRWAEQLRQEMQQAGPVAVGFSPLVEVQTAQLILDLLPDMQSQMELLATFPDGKKAKSGKDSLEQIKTFAKAGIAAGRMGLAPGLNGKMLDDAEKAMDTLSITQKGNDVVMSLKSPMNGKEAGQGIGEMLAAVGHVRQAAGNAQSMNNLKQLTLALHNYHDVNRRLPPAVIYSQDGQRPLYSWRVELLPYLEEQGLYNEFHKDEPWNSPHNLRLVNRMPKVFLMPDEVNNGRTHYQVFTGPNTVFERNRQFTLLNILDGTSNTVAIVEAAQAVTWTQPVDLTVPARGHPGNLLLWSPKNSSVVSMFDGSVRSIRRTVSEQTLRDAINPADGNVLGDDW
jgi:hypothetical protein